MPCQDTWADEQYFLTRRMHNIISKQTNMAYRKYMKTPTNFTAGNRNNYKENKNQILYKKSYCLTGKMEYLVGVAKYHRNPNFVYNVHH